LGFVASHLTIEQTCLGALRTFCLSQPSPLLKPIGFEEPANGRVGRDRLQFTLRLRQGGQIISMKLNAPTFVGGVLGEQRLAHSIAHRSLPTGIATNLATQRSHRIIAVLQALVEPPLECRETEADRRACDRVTPLLCGKLLDLGSQLARRRRGCQKSTYDGETQMRPPLMDSGTLFVCHATYSLFVERV
jgi:hypothetical protein